MMPVMVKEADLNRVDVPEDYEVLDATGVGRRLGSSGTRCSPTSPEGTFAAYPAPTVCLLWGHLHYRLPILTGSSTIHAKFIRNSFAPVLIKAVVKTVEEGEAAKARLIYHYNDA